MSDSSGADVDLVVDGGGSTTRVGLASAGRVVATVDAPSANPFSVGATSAVRHLMGALQQAVSMRPEGATIRVACLALSAISDNESLEDMVRAAHALAANAPSLAGVDWVVTNDVAPLMLDEPGELVVVVCGTGTSFVARGADGTVARASGREYLMSDEGGGFDIGLRGLRAVVRASDGRGPATDLTGAAAQIAGSVDELCAAVHAREDVKVFVADFAPHVLAAAADGDGVARAIVHDASVELATGVAAVVERASLSAPIRVRMSGSLLLGDLDVLRAGLERVIDSDADVAPISRTTLELVAALAAAVREGSPEVTALRQAFPFFEVLGGA